MSGIRHQLRALRAGEPGQRFQDAHTRLRADRLVVRIALIAVGCALAAVGALTFWIPGPNVVIVVAGLALVAAQWRLVARGLDRAELACRRWHRTRWVPYPHKRAAVAISIVVVLAVVGGAAWAAHELGWVSIPGVG